MSSETLLDIFTLEDETSRLWRKTLGTNYSVKGCHNPEHRRSHLHLRGSPNFTFIVLIVAFSVFTQRVMTLTTQGTAPWARNGYWYFLHMWFVPHFYTFCLESVFVSAFVFISFFPRLTYLQCWFHQMYGGKNRALFQRKTRSLYFLLFDKVALKHNVTRYLHDNKQKQQKSIRISPKVFVCLLNTNLPQKKLIKQHKKE
jgi:hypothetical protein